MIRRGAAFLTLRLLNTALLNAVERHRHRLATDSMTDSEIFQPQNDLERSMLAAQDRTDGAEASMAALVAALMEAQVFMPVKDACDRTGTPRESATEPLVLNDEQGEPVLALFTSPERAKAFVRNFPGFAGGLLTDLQEIMARWGVDYAIALNPGGSVGLDLPRAMVRQLGRVLLADASAPADRADHSARGDRAHRGISQ